MEDRAEQMVSLAKEKTAVETDIPPQSGTHESFYPAPRGGDASKTHLAGVGTPEGAATRLVMAVMSPRGRHLGGG